MIALNGELLFDETGLVELYVTAYTFVKGDGTISFTYVFSRPNPILRGLNL